MRKLYKGKKQIFFIAVLISFIIISACLIRISTPEDYWMCQNSVWVKHGKPTTPHPTAFCPVANTSSLSTDSVVENFYNWYFHNDKNIIQSGYYQQSDYLSQNFINNIKSSLSKNNNFDPFICEGRTENPISLSVQELYNKKNKAVVIVFQHYDVTQDRIEVTLYKKNNVWYINNVNCAQNFDSVQGIGNTQNIVEAN